MAKGKGSAVEDKKVWADGEQTGPVGWSEVHSSQRPGPAHRRP